MRYIIKTKELEDDINLTVGVEVGQSLYHKNIEYKIQKISIIDPEEGVIMLFCKRNHSSENEEIEVSYR